MIILATLIVYAGLAVPVTDAWHLVKRGSVSIESKESCQQDAGYFFALREVSLAKKDYIFLADPLKRAIFVDGDTNIVMSHTMTIKNGRGFSMYFSGANYNAILSLKNEKQIDAGTIGYEGTLFVRRGSEKLKVAVHGFQHR
ncbi:hypothetical protein [Dyadobacter sp. 676]|uniref:FecR domain-containing protein n=1 Tax=Dyadobacter sp. 676 TaxID=3088362 RepID=A0AAU8FH23_9BACT